MRPLKDSPSSKIKMSPPIPVSTSSISGISLISLEPYPTDTSPTPLILTVRSAVIAEKSRISGICSAVFSSASSRIWRISAVSTTSPTVSSTSLARATKRSRVSTTSKPGATISSATSSRLSMSSITRSAPQPSLNLYVSDPRVPDSQSLPNPPSSRLSPKSPMRISS